MKKPGRALNEQELAAYDVIPRTLAQNVRIVSIPRIPGGFVGITLGNIIALTREEPDDGTSPLLAHELVHVGQWHYEGRVRFVLSYVNHFSKGIARHRSWGKAYLNIGAEVEARAEATAWCKRCL